MTCGRGVFVPMLANCDFNAVCLCVIIPAQDRQADSICSKQMRGGGVGVSNMVPACDVDNVRNDNDPRPLKFACIHHVVPRQDANSDGQFSFQSTCLMSLSLGIYRGKTESNITNQRMCPRGLRYRLEATACKLYRSRSPSLCSCRNPHSPTCPSCWKNVQSSDALLVLLEAIKSPILLTLSLAAMERRRAHDLSIFISFLRQDHLFSHHHLSLILCW